MRVYILLTCILLVLVQAVPVEDEVHLANPIYKDHRWYSGYLNFTDGAFHYVFFDSQHDPDNDPLVIWLNGGPGCSSLIGMVYQNGPFVFPPNKTSFVLNDYAWNKKANLLYIQSPQGVGFSKGVNGTLPPLNDGTVATYNLKALLNFYIKFPNMKKNSLYITGQSYSGIYVPYLAYEIIKHNRLPSSKQTQILLKGIMVGNACTDPAECYVPGDGMSLYQYQFLFKHAYYSEQDYDHMRAVCTLGYNSDQCKQIRKNLDAKFIKAKTSILNIYAPCYEQNINSSNVRVRQSGRVTVDEGSCEDSLGDTLWFNEPQIQNELHVGFMKWEQCSVEVANKYQMFENASYWLYPLLMKENLKIWVFSGDVDADVPITGTVHWLQKLREEFNIPVMEPWREWWVPGIHKHQDQVGGMVWKLRGLNFISVKGAGHMVARDKRQAGYVLIESFLFRDNVPEKDVDEDL